MEWGKLLNDTRIRNIEKQNKASKDFSENEILVPSKEEILFSDHRNQFERDYDRINNSSAVRRLQDKAQVYPLQSNDFIRTRLTHSMEVSSIARSLGNFVERYLILNEVEGFSSNDAGKIPSILASAALVHDIGNPPFGHYGEDVIKNWFKNEYNIEKLRNWVGTCNSSDKLDNILRDYQSFDGNAQGLRVINCLQFFKDEYGLNLTVGTISTLLKYPFESSHSFAKTKGKFGYFISDKNLIEKIKTLTLGSDKVNFRNPLTYMLEAADDIAYNGSDVEDGVKKGSIPWDKEFLDFFENVKCNKPIAKHKKNDVMLALSDEEFDNLKSVHNEHLQFIEDSHPDPMVASARSFKVWAQGIFISEVKKVFAEKYDDIMSGKLGDFSETSVEGKFNYKELIDYSPKASGLRIWMKNLLVKYCFVDNEVVSLELVGDKVISDLLDVFLSECIFKIHDEDTLTKGKAAKIYSLISNNIKYMNIGNKNLYEADPYNRVQLVIDFISGMTDSYALDLHQKLMGVKMP